MSKDRIDIRKELKSYRNEFGLLQKRSCTPEENEMYLYLLEEGEELPEGVYRYKNESGKYTDSFYTIYEADLSQLEILEFLTYKLIKPLSFIKNYLVISIILCAIVLLVALLSL